MIEVVNENRLEQLEQLLIVLAEAIDNKPGARDLSQLAKQYRETLQEIEEIRGENNEEDEIGQLLSNRASDGKSTAIRQSLAKL